MKCTTFIVTLLALLLAPLARAEWELIYGAEEMEKIYAMASDGHRLYGYTKHGVFISPDDGYTWRPTGLNHAVITFTVGWDGAVYANGGHKHGLFRSDTHGDTWKEINDGLHTWEKDDGGLQFPSLVQILPTTSRCLIAIAHTGAYVSHNRGDSWQ